MLGLIVYAQVAVGVQLNADGDALAQRLGLTPADLAAQMRSAIDNAYGASNVDGFLRSFADATAFSMRGLGVDYASNPRSLVVGVGANLAVAATDNVDATERPTSGLAANLAFMAGLNLADQGAPRWTVYGNGFYRKGSTRSLRGGILSAGLHAQYRVMAPQQDTGVATKALRWIGIDLTWGIEITRWTLGIVDDIASDFGVTGASGNANITLDSTGRFDLSSSAATIPFEITTGIRIATLVGVYVGAAADVTAGSATLAANLDGTLVTSDNRAIGTATISGGGDQDASLVAGRVLAGTQLELWKLKAYAQVNASTTPAASVGFGIRGVL